MPKAVKPLIGDGVMVYLEISQAQLGLPLTSGPGADKALGPDLRDVLFGAHQHVFAIVDGARIPGLQEKLLAQNLPHMCLFSGEMAEEAGEMAPWVIALEPEAPLLRQMLCDVEGDSASVHGLMRAGAGIFVRGPFALADLRRHLRRFMRVMDTTNSPFYFRFWEPEAAAVYFRAIAGRADVSHRWMCPRDTSPIEAIIIPTWLDGPGLAQIELPTLPDPVPLAQGAFALELAEIDALRALQWRRDKWQLQERLQKTFPDVATDLGADLGPRVSAVVDRMVGLGFWRRDMLFTFCAWAAHYGEGVFERDPEGQIATILERQLPAEDRFAQVSKRMETLERDYFARPA